MLFTHAKLETELEKKSSLNQTENSPLSQIQVFS